MKPVPAAARAGAWLPTCQSWRWACRAVWVCYCQPAHAAGPADRTSCLRRPSRPSLPAVAASRSSWHMAPVCMSQCICLKQLARGVSARSQKNYMAGCLAVNRRMSPSLDRHPRPRLPPRPPPRHPRPSEHTHPLSALAPALLGASCHRGPASPCPTTAAAAQTSAPAAKWPC